MSKFHHLLNRVRHRCGLPLAEHQRFDTPLRDLHGVEIGGPSAFFRTKLRVYLTARSVDQVNFSADTVWSRANQAQGDGPILPPALAQGRSIVCDGTALTVIADAKYDFLLSCHNLEHIANPLRALAEWTRVVRPQGHLLLILPNPVGNFDHRRPVTRFAHLLDDHARGVDERDLTQPRRNSRLARLGAGSRRGNRRTVQSAQPAQP